MVTWPAVDVLVFAPLERLHDIVCPLFVVRQGAPLVCIEALRNLLFYQALSIGLVCLQRCHHSILGNGQRLPVQRLQDSNVRTHPRHSDGGGEKKVSERRCWSGRHPT